MWVSWAVGGINNHHHDVLANWPAPRAACLWGRSPAGSRWPRPAQTGWAVRSACRHSSPAPTLHPKPPPSSFSTTNSSAWSQVQLHEAPPQRNPPLFSQPKQPLIQPYRASVSLPPLWQKNKPKKQWTWQTRCDKKRLGQKNRKSLQGLKKRNKKFCGQSERGGRREIKHFPRAASSVISHRTKGITERLSVNLSLTATSLSEATSPPPNNILLLRANSRLCDSWWRCHQG